MGNQALDINPDVNSGGHADIAITTHGSDWYFTVAAVMTFSTLIFWGLSFRRPQNQRIFHYITAGITLIGAIAYFTEGSNLGWTPIRVEFQRSDANVHGLYRQIFYVRYIDYFISLPLILLNLLLTAALPWPTILYTILINWVMVVSFLVGTLVKSTYKWGYFAFATTAFFFMAYTILWSARSHAAALGGSIYRTYLSTSVVIFFLWLLYPIAWGVSEGGNVIAPDSEAVFYGIIDILSKPFLGFWFLWGHKDINLATLGLEYHDLTTNPDLAATNGQNAHHFTGSRYARIGSLLHRRSKAETEGSQATEGTDGVAAPAPVHNPETV